MEAKDMYSRIYDFTVRVGTDYSYPMGDGQRIYQGISSIPR